MGKRIVIALGGNALGNNLPEQMKAVKITARAMVDLIEDGNEVVICHGNGPQVGMIQNAMAELTRSDPEKYIPCPLSVCVAMSQGYIGYDLQNAMREEMLDRGISKGAATVLTQVEVDPEDPAFRNPTKPIGPFMTEKEARKLEKERDYHVMEDAGRGWRRVVASPEPKGIVEIDTIRSLVETDHIVVACGGGGIPVFKTEGHHLKGAAAVIDKDFAAAVLAKQLNADLLIILTAVEKVAIHFGKPDQQLIALFLPVQLLEQFEMLDINGDEAPAPFRRMDEAVLHEREEGGFGRLVRHLAERQDFDSVLSCHYAIVCEIDEMISVAIEQDTMVGTPLIAVVHDSLIKYPTLHIIQHN